MRSDRSDSALSSASDCENVVVLAPLGSPSLDYYLQNIRDRAPGAKMHIIDSSHRADDSLSIAQESWLIVVRHTHKSWIKWLVRQRNNLTRVTWFLDDDVAGTKTERSLPRLYAWRTFLRYATIRRNLLKLATEMAFSTPELATRYPEKPSEIWAPRHVATPRKVSPMTYFYHGTSAHRAEMEWLLPIVENVQTQMPNAWFEIMSDTYARKLYRHVPRVRMLHPMSWPDFLEYTSSFPQHVGLAPLFPTHFNLARSHVKFFDITRTGAAGIYSNIGPYPDHIKNGETGILLPNDPDRWVEAITYLLTHPAERERLQTNALQICTEGESLSDETQH